jgi:predicted ATPase
MQKQSNVDDCFYAVVKVLQLFERRPNWGEGREAHTRLELKPLSRRASRALVSEILQKVESIPQGLRDLVVDGAEGNSFYVEELIKMLIEGSVILRGEERWCVELGRLARVRVPPTLTGVLQARLDSLPRQERTLLQRASVVGRLFWDTAVAALVGGQRRRTHGGVDGLSYAQSASDALTEVAARTGVGRVAWGQGAYDPAIQ